MMEKIAEDEWRDVEHEDTTTTWRAAKIKRPRRWVHRKMVLLACLLTIGFIGLLFAYTSKGMCMLVPGACRGSAPQSSGVCFLLREEVATQEITAGTTTVGAMTLFYSPVCRSAFARVVLTRPGAVADLSVQLLIEHPGSYTEITDSGILSQRHEVWSVFVPVPSGTMISASATMATSRTTMVIQTSKTFLASW